MLSLLHRDLNPPTTSALGGLAAASPVRRYALLVLGGLLLVFGAFPSFGQAPLGNDHFTNAYVLQLPSGQITDNNLTSDANEPGEPVVPATVGGASVWFVWTAPNNGAYSFNTIGSDFDTTLGVYTGNSVSGLAVVGQNDDLDPNSNPPIVQSRVTFVAIAGSTYYIAVDGYAPASGDTGNIVLNWGPEELFGGDFSFTSPLYIFSANEATSGPQDGRMDVHNPSARLTITRKLGVSGNARVVYSITNTMYTNYLFTNFFGTNYFTTNIDLTTTPNVIAFTNLTSTNVAWTNFYQNYEYGQFGWIAQPGSVLINCTNIGVNGSANNPGQICSSVVQAPPTNWVFLNQTTSTNVDYTNSMGQVTNRVIFVTNIFAFTRYSTNRVPTATAGTDYILVTNQPVAMRDFQTAVDIQTPFFGAPNRFPLVNGVLVATITGAHLATDQDSPDFENESPLIPEPTFGVAGPVKTYINILNRAPQGGSNSVDGRIFLPAVPPTGVSFLAPVGPNGRPITDPPVLPLTPGVGYVGTNVFNFERALIECRENIGTARIWVIRSGNLVGNTSASINYRIDWHPVFGNSAHNSFREGPYFPLPEPGDFTNPELLLQAGSDYATPNDHQGFSSSPTDYTSVTGTLTFGPTVTRMPIDIPINNDGVVEFDEDMLLQLFDPNPNPNDHCLGYVRDCVLTIRFNDQPAGACDRNYNPDGVNISDPPFNLIPGANSSVKAVAVQPADDKTIIGGSFTAYNTHVQNHVTRINTDGTIDTGFTNSIGTATDDSVETIDVDTAGNILLGGAFTSFNGTSRKAIARLHPDGTLDNSFDPGLGANDNILAVLSQAGGTIVIGGQFTSYNGTNRTYVARLNNNGTIDPSFDPGQGPDARVLSLDVQSDGKIVIVGEFSNVSGTARSHVARLNSDGTLDTGFDPGTGADDNVRGVKVQPDGKIIIVGDFNSVRNANRKGICRLNSDGTIDTTFNPGTGSDDIVQCVKLQPDGKILIGGPFKQYNQTRRVGFARLLTDGSVDTTFLDVAYNQYAGIPNTFWDPTVDPPNFVASCGVQSDGRIMIAGSFLGVGGGSARDAISTRYNVARLIGGETPGPGNVLLTSDTYTADENGQIGFVTMLRTNGTLGPATVDFSPQAKAPGPGSAVPGVDYSWDPKNSFLNNATPNWPSSYDVNPQDTWQVQDGSFGPNQNNALTVDPGLTLNTFNDKTFVTMIDNTNIDGNRDFLLELAHPRGFDQLFLGTGGGAVDANGFTLGENIPTGLALGRAEATMTIVDNDSHAGILSFALDNFTVGEATKFATITVTRTNGTSGQVQVNYTTADGTNSNTAFNAVAPGDYLPKSGVLTFLDNGATQQTFQVQIVNDTLVEEDEKVNLILSSPNNGARLGRSFATLTIVDNDNLNGRLNFASANFTTNENAGAAIITVNRNGSSAGTLVGYYVVYDTNVPSLNGTNYIAVTNSLTWNNNDVTPKTFTVPLIDNTIVDGNHTINLALVAATVNGATNTGLIGAQSNSVLTIVDDDAYGTLGFTRPVYNAMENGGPAVITVHRSLGIAQTLTVNFTTIEGSATPNFDYSPTNGVLNFAPGEVAKSFTVPIIDHPPSQIDASNRTVILQLFAPTPNSSVLDPLLAQATLNIVDDETFNEPAGLTDTTLNFNLGFDGDVFALGLQTNGMIVAAGDFLHANSIARNRIARLNPDGSLDASFSSATASVSAAIRALVIQSDGRMVIGGFFTNVNGNVINRIARLDYTGNLNNTFNPGAGADNSVFALAETFAADGSRRILVGGAFVNLAGTSRSGIGRLNDDGSADGTFDPGIGANGTVFAIAVYPTNSVRSGQVLIGGDFTAVNGQSRNHIARLNANGSLDLSFNPPSGANDSVRSIAIQTDENILIGGLFTNVNSSAFNRIARLLPSGATDTSFTPAPGGNDIVSVIALQPDNKILLGGQFTVATGVTRNRITRLNSDGTVDPTINFGLGADSFVAALLVQPNDRIVLGGGFMHYDGLTAPHITRIFGRNLNGSGTFEFDAANYFVMENGTNAVVTIRRRGGTSGFPSGNVFITMATSNGTAVAGVNFSNVVTTIAFPAGEVFENVSIPVIDDFVVNADRFFTNYLFNPQPSGGPALGNQASSTVRIINDDSSLSFKSATYSVNEDISSGVANIEIVRAGSILGSSTVNFSTAFGGTAVAGVNYNPTNAVISFGQGQSNAFVQVPILHDPLPSGDKTLSLILSNASGSILLAPSQATLTIIDVENAPGQFVFSAPAYFAGEGDGVAPITIIRTNGHSGVVTVHYTTVDGTARAGVNYLATNNTLTFDGGVTVQSFNVPLIDDNIVGGPTTLSINLSNPTGGASILAPTNVPLTIFDNDIGLTLSSPAYSVSEDGGSLTVSVVRLNGSNGAVSVQYTTTNGTATSGVNYTAISGTLNFANGETLKTLTIPILQDNQITGNQTFGIRLFNLQPPAAAQLVTSLATVTILDTTVGFFISNSVYSVSEAGTNVTVTVLRTNSALAGNNSVSFFTTDGTATAGVKYAATSGTFNFTNGQASRDILIPIIQETAVEGDQTFTVTIATNAQSGGAQLLTPSVATVTIIDDDSGFKFSTPNYSVSEGGVSATITVLRTGVTNSFVSVDFATADGTSRAGVHYFPTNGTLSFAPGEVAKQFTVQVIDENVIEGDHTVLLSLSNPTGQSSLVPPSAAVLTIIDNDGSLIVPAGAALTSDPNGNGVIDPGETVTLLLGLRNSKGSPTTNLVATLQANNSVTPITTSQSYGVLVQDGPSVSRPFTFTANGTNSGTVTVTLQLTDGSSTNGFPSTATFTYSLGTSSARFTNSGSITINDNSAASPYPSVITVSGINGAVTKASVTISNLSHTHSADVDVLLASPAGANVVLMANAGSAGVSRANLTFDDDAAGFLPSATGIVTGTNKPTAYPAVPPFPAPAPAGPYSTAMSAFNNSNPNGDWSLYVQDDTSVNTGGITNGWILSLTTANLVLPSADIKVTVSDLPDPVTVGSNLTYSITISNFGPASASGVTLTSILPPNLTNISASIGGYSLNGTGITFTNLGTLAKDARLSFTISGNPSSAGTVSNMTSVAANENDPFGGDNGATNVTTVLAPSADLVLSLLGSPDPVTLGGNITYSMSVSNAGLATATGVRLTNTLPASVTIVSTSAGASTNGNVVIFDLGTLGNGVTTNSSIVVRAGSFGQITDSASVGSTILDPLKVNNSASIKIIVEPVLLSVSRTGSTVSISWPASAVGYVLEASGSLSPQSWSQVTVPPPVLIGDQQVVTLGATNSARYFRLHTP